MASEFDRLLALEYMLLQCNLQTSPFATSDTLIRCRSDPPNTGPNHRPDNSNINEMDGKLLRNYVDGLARHFCPLYVY